MQIGVNTWVWASPINNDEFSRITRVVADMGFDLIEVPIEGTGDLDYAGAAVSAREAGLGVSVCAAMGPDRDLIHPDSSVRATGMEYLRHCIAATRALGATNLVGPLYSAVGRTWHSTEEERARDTELLVRQLGELSSYAEDHGVVLCVEPLNRFETSFINLASQAIDVVDRVNSRACGIMLDTFHMNVEERSLGDAIRAAGPRLKHLHACENDRGAPVPDTYPGPTWPLPAGTSDTTDRSSSSLSPAKSNRSREPLRSGARSHRHRTISLATGSASSELSCEARADSPVRLIGNHPTPATKNDDETVHEMGRAPRGRAGHAPRRRGGGERPDP